jgi:thymidylate kinase
LPDNDSEIADILVALFQSLNREGIKYCVLRDYEGLPQEFRSDLDCLVNAEDRFAFQSILTEIAAQRGWHLVKHVRKYALWFFYFYPAHTGGEGRFILHVDLFYTIAWKGFTYLTAQDITRERMSHKTFYTPRPCHEAAVLLLKDLLHVGCVRQKYRARIQSLIQQDAAGLRSCLEPAFGRDLGHFLAEAAMQGKWDQIEARRRVLQWGMAWRAFTQAPMAQMVEAWRWAWGHLHQPISHPAGVFIVVLGSDGCGKTTVIYELMPLIEKLFTRMRRLAFNFNTVPHILGDLRKWIHRRWRIGHISLNEGDREGPRLTPFPIWRALAHLAYHTVGFLLGYAFLFAARRQGELIIVERYFYDYFIQPLYARMPRWLLNAILRLLPKPDAVIYLYGDPQLIHDRKTELPVNEIERQQAIFTDLLAQVPNGLVIDVSAPVSAVARQIAHLICQVIGAKSRTI